MRINLVTPFAEKDAAKALGARWDAAKKCWYIVDVPDLTPFLHWIPDMQAATNSSAAAKPAPRSKAKELPQTPDPAAAPGLPVKDFADCGCDVLPWDDCPHTAKS
jgi:hypothetical protein